MWAAEERLQLVVSTEVAIRAKLTLGRVMVAGVPPTCGKAATR